MRPSRAALVLFALLLLPALAVGYRSLRGRMSEGNEAMQALGGAFATDAAKAGRLSAAKRDKHDINQRASEYLQWQALKPAETDND